MDYLDFIRQQDCVACGKPGPSDAHHAGLRCEHKVGMGQKCADSSCISLCRACHTYWHSKGRLAFEEKFHIDIKKTIERMNKEWDLSLHR